MDISQDWQVFEMCSHIAAAVPVADYLNMHACPAQVLSFPPSFGLAPTAAVVVPAEFYRRAQHIWANANVLGDLTEGELGYIVTGRLAFDVMRGEADVGNSATGNLHSTVSGRGRACVAVSLCDTCVGAGS
jgi:hypothetical protein